MGSDKWRKLTPEMRSIWDKLDDESKRIILGTSNQRSINLHDLSAYELLQLQAHRHELVDHDQEEYHDTHQDPDPDPDPDPPENSDLLVNAAKSSKAHPGDVRRLLADDNVRKVKVHESIYRVSAHNRLRSKSSLIDRGANGGVAGEDLRPVPNGFTHRYADIEGIDNHRVTHKQIGTFGGVATTQNGPVILIFNEYAYHGKGPTIHASGQLEHYGIDVNDKSRKIDGGLQRLVTPEGYFIPLDIVNGLVRLKLRPFTDHEWDTLPMVIMTADREWDPNVLDDTYDHDAQWFDAVDSVDKSLLDRPFDATGNYRRRTDVQLSFFDAIDASPDPDEDLDTIIDRIVYESHKRDVRPSPRDYEKLRPRFGWLPASVVEKTFSLTTQFGKLPTSTILKKHYKSPNPALNVKRREEDLATDTVFSDTPAIDDGSTVAQFFVVTR